MQSRNSARILLFPSGLFLTRGNFLSATVSIHELSQLRCSGQNLEIVDVRSETEFAPGHIPGAKCIPLQQFPLRHADLGDGDLVLVCEAGMRASMAQKNPNQHSGRVFVLDGGMRAWREAGLLLIPPLGTVGRWSGKLDWGRGSDSNRNRAYFACKQGVDSFAGICGSRTHLRGRFIARCYALAATAKTERMF